EQHRRDTDRVRARHRRVFGRLHDDVAGGALVAGRRDNEIRVYGNAAARLAQQEAPQRVVARERPHLLEHGVARRRQHTADDDVADLTAGVAADDRQYPFQFELTPTFATKMSDFLPLDGVALPQLRTSWLGESVEIPVVSPGQTSGSPNSVDTCCWAESQPLLGENARRYSAYPRGSLGESQLTYAVPAAPPTTAMMCGTFAWSAGAWTGADQIRP